MPSDLDPAPPRRPRVLVSALGPMVRLGLNRILSDGVEVVGDEAEPDALVRAAGRLRPDAIVLTVETGGPGELAHRLRAAAPEAKLVYCGRDDDVLEVLDPGASASRRIGTPAADRLLHELTASSTNAKE